MFVKGRSVQVLLDTGTCYQLYPCSWFVSWEYQSDHLRRTIVLKMVGGYFLNVCGKVALDLSINHLAMSHDFVVADNITPSVLLGYNFMYKYDLRMHFVNRTVSFVEGLTVAKLLNRSKKSGKNGLGQVVLWSVGFRS